MKTHHLELSPGKSSATLLTLWTKEANTVLNISIGNAMVPTVKNPKILGVTFDPLLTFNQHSKNVRNKLLVAIGGKKGDHVHDLKSYQSADCERHPTSSECITYFITGCHTNTMLHEDHIQI